MLVFFSKVAEFVRQFTGPKAVAPVNTKALAPVNTKVVDPSINYLKALRHHGANVSASLQLTNRPKSLIKQLKVTSEMIAKSGEQYPSQDKIDESYRQRLQQTVEAQDPKMEGAGGLPDPVRAVKAQGLINKFRRGSGCSAKTSTNNEGKIYRCF